MGNSQKNLFEKINDESAEKDEIMEYNWENNKKRGDTLDTEEMIAKSQQAGSVILKFVSLINIMKVEEKLEGPILKKRKKN